ncbi:protein NEDD1-like [Anoplophora glabripennis]|uniref:protein NEDD1-like n=1 Tax=Anoplophora glabripennis TaxID=217634 RepID=UPI000C771E5B|nr:protein NEDD1-like [Anoplophora glabripennis]
MTLAACAKDVKFYRWPNICYTGVYETPVDCMAIKTISWSCNGKKLLVVKSKGSPVIICPPSKPEQYIEPFDCIHTNNASVATFSNTNPNLLALGTENGSVYLFNLKSKQKLPQEFKKLPGNIQNLEFSSDDQCIAAGCLNGQIFLYDSKFKLNSSFVVPNSPTLSTMAYSKFTPNLLAGASKEGVLCLWDTEATDIILSSKNHENRITDVTFFETILSTVGIDGNFITYDLRTCDCTARYELDCPLSSLAYLPGSMEMAVSTMSGQLRSYDQRNMKSPLRTHVAYISGGIKKIAFPNVNEALIVPTHAYQKKYTKCYEDNFSASGDFSIFTDSSVFDSPKLVSVPDECEEECVGASAVEVFSPARKPDNVELEELAKALEDRVKSTVKDFEEKLLQTFYGLRINTSKQFIGLEEKISQSWNSFVDYLRFSGATSGTASAEKTSQEELTQPEHFSSVADCM